MRHNQNRRSRGRSRKGPNPLTRSYESNGPDVKVRGTAAHVAEKYMSLARDAQSSGDPVAAENYLQHAEHYNRIVAAAQAQAQQVQPQFREGGEEGFDDDRQMNGRMRDRFESNGNGREDDDDRIDAGEGDDDRGYRARQEQGDRQRGPRGDRGERPDRREGRSERPERPERPERRERQDEAEAGADTIAEAASPEEQPVPRRRRRPARAEAVEAKDGDDATPDGAAALAAFPD